MSQKNPRKTLIKRVYRERGSELAHSASFLIFISLLNDSLLDWQSLRHVVTYELLKLILFKLLLFNLLWSGRFSVSWHAEPLLSNQFYKAGVHKTKAPSCTR